MIAIYRMSFACIRKFWWFFLLIALILEVASAALDSKARLGGELFLQFSFVYFLHRHMLLGEGPDSAFGGSKTARASGRRGFLWVMMIYVFSLSALTLAGFIWLSPVPITTVPGLLLFVLFFILGNWIGLSFFGTAFPASATGDAFGLRVTYQRARSTWLATALRLLLGPAIVGAVGIGLLILLPILRGIMPGLELADLQKPFEPILIVRGLLGLAARLSGMTATTLAVAILCEAYRSIQPAPVDTTA